MSIVQERAQILGAEPGPPAWARDLPELGAAPGGLAIGPDGTLAASEPTAHRVCLYGSAGELVVIGGRPARVDGPSGEARFRMPKGLAFDGAGALCVADNHVLRRVSPEGKVTTLAGGTLGWADGPGAEARFRFPGDVAVGPDGWTYVADTANNRIRRVSPGGEVSTLAGSIFDCGGGLRLKARFRWPAGIAVGHDGVVYVADTGNNRVCRIGPDGAVTTLAGGPGGGAADGRDTRAGLRWPMGLALGPEGALYVADSGNEAIRRVSPAGVLTTVAHTPGWQPVAGAVGADGRALVACTRWAPRGSEGRLRWL